MHWFTTWNQSNFHHSISLPLLFQTGITFRCWASRASKEESGTHGKLWFSTATGCELTKSYKWGALQSKKKKSFCKDMSKLKWPLPLRWTSLQILPGPSLLPSTLVTPCRWPMVAAGPHSPDKVRRQLKLPSTCPFVRVTFPGLCSQANYLRNRQL